MADIKPIVNELRNWSDVADQLGAFPAPRLAYDPDGDLQNHAWIFRGVNDSSFELEPGIERCAKGSGIGWAALESKASEEFKNRAHVYLNQPLTTTDELTWLALMQHYGVPTRLLDFTLSPFVALYFAARHCANKDRKAVRVWAINSQLINTRCAGVVWNATKADEERRGVKRSHKVSLLSEDALTDRDVLISESAAMQQRNREVLTATGTFRSKLNKQGCVSVAFPPSFNPRLGSQQGLFLLNGAEELIFTDSLARMMKDDHDWCKAFDIPVAVLPDIETRLFQMNIHELSLFPDMNGLAGLVNQKIRLHWT
jgi:hypothetical protein